MSNLTEKEQATNFVTMRHIERVRNLINRCVKILLEKGENHDQSKLEYPEVQIFAEHTEKLSKLTYNSDEYNNCKLAMKPALDHHYANNDHHPEFHKNGINDMDLLDILEMLCDWKAASERHENGNINKSIEINANRFGISPQLTKIMENTAKKLFK